MSALLERVQKRKQTVEDREELDIVFGLQAEAIVEALEADGKERLAVGDQRTCVQQVHGDSHIQCGTCSMCLEQKVLRDLAEALGVGTGGEDGD